MTSPSLFNDSVRILIGDATESLRTLPGKAVHTCITSPPYWGLRDYGVSGQIGLENSPDEYITRLVAVFHEVKRVLRDDGTLWINIGDSYSGSGRGQYADGCNDPKRKKEHGMRLPKYAGGLPPKNLIGIPWRLALALQADGWILRQDIIWSKLNPMPESVTDRCTNSHEHIFLLSKKSHYYFDAGAIKEPSSELSKIRSGNKNMARYGGKKYTESPDKFYRTKSGNAYAYRPFRNKRSVWTCSTDRYSGSHFATFPPQLIEPCVLAGSPPGGAILDPFAGSGTTGGVALKRGRSAVLIEINQQYADIIPDRISSILNTTVQAEPPDQLYLFQGGK